MSTLIPLLLQIQNTIKIYHWTTQIYSRHMAADKLYNELTPLIDRMVEVYLGRYGRSRQPSAHSFSVQQLTDKTAPEFLDQFITMLLSSEVIPHKAPELITIRDEMIAVLRQAIYLFAFK